MKRPILILSTIFFLGTVFSSCKSQERCPAYGQEKAEEEQEERI